MFAMLPYLAGLGFLLFLSAFFSGSETALFSLSKVQVERFRQGRTKRGNNVVRLLNNPRRLLITILVGNMFVNVAAASLVASFATALMGNTGVGVAVVFTTILLLIFGEVTPKTIAVHNAESISKLVAYPIQLFSELIFPLRIVLRAVINFFIRLLGIGSIPVEDRLTTEELKVMVNIAKEEGSIKEQEKQMLNTIFDLRSITAAEIMVPRTEMVCISGDSTLQQAFDLARTEGLSRIPVYKENLDHIYGMLLVRDFPLWRHYDILQMTIEQFQQDRQKLWPGGRKTLIRQPFLVPETRTAMGLFQDLRDNGVHLAILLDEYGGTSGLATMEDLVEELVGEIIEEYDGQGDDASEHLRRLDHFTTLVSGGTSIRNVNRKLGLNLPVEEDIDTIGGYVFHLFGRVPENGEIFSADGLEFKVEGLDRQRITHVVIKKVDSG